MQIFFHWGVGEGTSSSDETSFSANNFAQQLVKIIIIKLSVFFGIKHTYGEPSCG